MHLVLPVCFILISFCVTIEAQFAAFAGRRGGAGQIGRCGGDGWFFHNGVCYYIEAHTKATFEEARMKCRQMGSTLYVPKSTTEYNTVMSNTAAYGFSWIGLSQTRAFEPTWEMRNRVDYKQLNWLVKPYEAGLNGFSQLARCVVFYNGNIDSGRYTYWKSCNDRNYFVCERNSGAGLGPNIGFGGPGSAGFGPSTGLGGPGNGGIVTNPGFSGAGNAGFGPDPGFAGAGNAGFHHGGHGFGRHGPFGFGRRFHDPYYG